ncbi:hypothetical protein TBK1r_75820 [Stieleria magnilauensis]|uniref:Uncharacterized protein n=1 Tax=Stieleria magnilauensis TaxID=2527963 RepID=A0ABX5Y430_9BACT|nr:hypothetical protein TBK1r_75820 [Planctomycetes bacterium TBK1r]
MLSLRWSAGAFTLSHPWPFEMWIGVVTSIFSEGLFRGNINRSAITFRLKCSYEPDGEKTSYTNFTASPASTMILVVIISTLLQLGVAG